MPPHTAFTLGIPRPFLLPLTFLGRAIAAVLVRVPTSLPTTVEAHPRPVAADGVPFARAARARTAARHGTGRAGAAGAAQGWHFGGDVRVAFVRRAVGVGVGFFFGGGVGFETLCCVTPREGLDFALGENVSSTMPFIRGVLFEDTRDRNEVGWRKIRYQLRNRRAWPKVVSAVSS